MGSSKSLVGGALPFTDFVLYKIRRQAAKHKLVSLPRQFWSTYRVVAECRASTSCNSWSTGAWEDEKIKTLMKKAAQPLHQCLIEICGSPGLDFNSWGAASCLL